MLLVPARELEIELDPVVGGTIVVALLVLVLVVFVVWRRLRR